MDRLFVSYLPDRTCFLFLGTISIFFKFTIKLRDEDLFCQDWMAACTEEAVSFLQSQNTPVSQDWMAACTEEAVSFFCALQQSGQVEKLYQADCLSSTTISAPLPSSPPDLVYSVPQPSYSCQVS